MSGTAALSSTAATVIARSGDGSTDASPFGLPTAGVSSDQYAAALDAEYSDAGRRRALSVYIHLPFCPSRCLSCDHNTTVTHDTAEVDRYLKALDVEMGLVTGVIGTGLPLGQVHLGGGTPNYLTDPQLVQLVDVIEKHFTIDDGTDTSLEASPKRSSLSQLELLRGLGFRRINFEVRDLDPSVQMALGRVNSLPMLQDVFDNARAAGFETIGMDLVYGLPNQSSHSIRRTVSQVLTLAPDRVACFSYSRRPEAFAHQSAIDAGSLPSLADKLAMFNAVVEMFQAGDYTWVGLDCFARNDDVLSLAQARGELHRNWIGYTTSDSRQMLGFGTHAVSELSNLSVQNHLLIPEWREALDHGSFPLRGGVSFTSAERERRHAMNDLLCNMELKDYAALACVGEEDGPLALLQANGLVDIQQQRVVVTPQGRHVLHGMWGDASPGFRWQNLW